MAFYMHFMCERTQCEYCADETVIIVEDDEGDNVTLMGFNQEETHLPVEQRSVGRKAHISSSAKSTFHKEKTNTTGTFETTAMLIGINQLLLKSPFMIFNYTMLCLSLRNRLPQEMPKKLLYHVTQFMYFTLHPLFSNLCKHSCSTENITKVI